MNCPYCNKRTSDMPDHLRDNKRCHERHKERLKAQLIYSVVMGRPRGQRKRGEAMTDIEREKQQHRRLVRRRSARRRRLARNNPPKPVRIAERNKAWAKKVINK